MKVIVHSVSRPALLHEKHSNGNIAHTSSYLSSCLGLNFKVIVLKLNLTKSISNVRSQGSKRWKWTEKMKANSWKVCLF